MIRRPTDYVLLVTMSAVAVIGILGLFAEELQTSTMLIVSTVGGATIALLVLTLASRLATASLPIAHAVAFVGFPASGKTTLITSIFGEVFARRVLIGRVTPRGQSTIERINEQLERLEKGKAIGPTSDQDRFSYRADISTGYGLFTRTYKVEFGDFPGEDSLEYAEKGHLFGKSEYFKWVAQADAIVFVVDAASLLIALTSNDNSYIATSQRAIRSAWQHLLDAHEGKEEMVRRRPVVLAFTKCDIFGTLTTEPDDRVAERIAHLGFSGDIPGLKPIDPAALTAGQSIAKEAFRDLIRYLSGESRSFQVVWVSSFATLNGVRLGIPDVLEAVLPRQPKIFPSALPASKKHGSNEL